MKLIKASYTILTPINGEEILKQIELAARSCYQSEGKIEYIPFPVFDDKGIEVETKDYAKSARILISKLMNLNHEAMLEFGGMITVRFIVDRGISHELVRHRIASFAQESTRYCNYNKGEHITFIIPNWFNRVSELEAKTILELHNSIEDIPGVDYEFNWCIKRLEDEEEYKELISNAKWTPQQARGVLPTSLKTEINISANIREWRHIFKQRTAKNAHPQMREVMCPLLDEFKSKIPILFDDINY